MAFRCTMGWCGNDGRVRSRHVVAAVVAAAVLGLTGVEGLPKLAFDFGGQPGFYHGVASGAPLEDAVLLWTRYTPKDVLDSPSIEYRIAELPPEQQQPKQDPPVEEDFDGMVAGWSDLLDPRKNAELRYGIVPALPRNDWTVKVDVQGLKPKTNYIYAFSDGNGATSQVGRTKTAPAADDPVEEGLNFAVFSCSNFRTGYFHVYEIGSRILGLDFWVHVGDYIYENYGGKPDPPPGTRQFFTEPKTKIITLDDYRLRYASYHTDRALQRLRAAAPLIATWDDHEFADNSHKDGARGHASGDGPWSARVRAAVKAYFEWIPIRPGPGNMGPFVPGVSISQTLEFGKLATIVSMDTRISHRSGSPAENGDPIKEMEPAFRKQDHYDFFAYRREPMSSEFQVLTDDILKRQYDPRKKIIGDHQRRYLANAFRRSKEAGKPWQIFAAPVLMGYDVFPPHDTVWQYVPRDLQEEFRDELIVFMARSERNEGGKFRATIPMAEASVCQGFDDWCGAAWERAEILKVMKETAVTSIVLGGDRHSSWAWTLFEGGNSTGTPVAVNIGAPGVTSGGEGKALQRFLKRFRPQMAQNRTTERELYQAFHTAWEEFNEGLKYSNVLDRGFFSVRLTRKLAFFEFYHIDFADLKRSFEITDQLYPEKGGLVPFYCGASLRSDAGVPGSLLRRLDQKEKRTYFASRPVDFTDIAVSLEFGPIEGRFEAPKTIFRDLYAF